MTILENILKHRVTTLEACCLVKKINVWYAHYKSTKEGHWMKLGGNDTELTDDEWVEG